MKRKLSISIDEGTFSKIECLLEDGTFRNKSHIVELVLNRFIEGEKE